MITTHKLMEMLEEEERSRTNRADLAHYIALHSCKLWEQLYAKSCERLEYWQKRAIDAEARNERMIVERWPG